VLRPQDSSTCERKDLDGFWAFRLDFDSVGGADRWYATSLAEARERQRAIVGIIRSLADALKVA
jgi:beta-galactosidase/beta-glucuronidase